MNITQRIDAVTKIDDIRYQMGGIQKPPKSVKIELTNNCNLKCGYCAVRTRKNYKPMTMDMGLFRSITTDMRISGVEEIGLFFLGESFTAPTALAEACKWVKDSLGFPYVFLTSNATCATPESVEQLMRYGLDSLKWSVNYGDLEQFKTVTGGTQNQYTNALNNIRVAKKIRDAGGYKTMLSASSIMYVGEQRAVMEQMLKDNVIPYVDKHYWLPLYQMSMYKESIEKELGYTPTAGNMGRLDEETLQPTRKPIPCWTVFTEGHVRVDGGFAACCFGADERFDMGILDGNNFMKVWNNEGFRKLRQAHLNTLEKGQSALMGTACEVCVAYEG